MGFKKDGYKKASYAIRAWISQHEEKMRCLGISYNERGGH